MPHSVDLAYVIGGFGIFLYAMRAMTGALDRSVRDVFKVLLGRVVNTRLHSVASGTVLTALVQASSITVVATMGLLTNGLISLEQGIGLMLGATLGTTAKAWFFANGDLRFLGPLLIGTGSVALMAVRRPLRRAFLELFVSVGFAFLGLDMLAQGLAPLAASHQFNALLQAQHVTTFGSQALTALVGCVATMAIQSSSTVVLVTMQLASQGVLSLPVGAAIILGANVGTTITPLVASIEFRKEVRRLAVAHLLVKALGVMMTLVFFPEFLSAMNALARPFGSQVSFQLATVHTGFNVINVAFWSLLLPVVTAMVRALVPGERPVGLALPVGVRRMLASAPQVAVQESDSQLALLKNLIKTFTDDILETLGDCLTHDSLATAHVPNPEGFEELLDSNEELTAVLAKGVSAQVRVKRNIQFVQRSHTLFLMAKALRDHLEWGALIGAGGFSPGLAVAFEGYRTAFDGVWLGIYCPGQGRQAAAELPCAVEALQNVLAARLADPNRKAEMDHWLQEAVRHLGLLANDLLGLYDMGPVAASGTLSAMPGAGAERGDGF